MSNFDITTLNKSSFRGVPFYTQSTELSSGHRLTDHSFINGGTQTEDNGLENKTFKISGYLGGANYLDEKQNLIDALDIIGSGTLIDKFYGTKQVQVDKYTAKEEKTKFGQVTFEITFKLEENKLKQQSLLVYAEDITTEVLDNFRLDYTEGLGLDTLTKVALGIVEVLQTIEDTIKFLEDARDFVQNIKTTIGRVIASIKVSVLRIDSLINEILDIATSFDDVLNFDSYGAKDQNALTNNLRETTQNINAISYENKVEEAAAKNIKAFTIAINTLLMQTAIKNLENVTYPSGDEFGTTKDDILSIIEILEENIVSDLNDDITRTETRLKLLDGYQRSKKEFIKFYTQKYSGLQNLQDVEVLATTDLLSLALDKYTDIDRIDEVIENNDIVDPIFVNGNLKLLVR